MIKSLFVNLIDYIFPHRCLSCTELTEKSNGVCGKCWKNLEFITKPYCLQCGKKFEFKIENQFLCGKCISTPPEYTLCRSLFTLSDSSKHLIHAFKYNDKTNYAKFFASLLYQYYRKDFDDIDFVVPVPMHRLKRIYRNYNPAQILAKELSTLTNKPMIPDLLIKIKWTKPQTLLSKRMREKNLAGSIVFNEKYDVKNKIILLTDDVHTTGTTTNTCSKILKKYKVSEVKLATIART